MDDEALKKFRFTFWGVIGFVASHVWWWGFLVELIYSKFYVQPKVISHILEGVPGFIPPTQFELAVISPLTSFTHATLLLGGPIWPVIFYSYLWKSSRTGKWLTLIAIGTMTLLYVMVRYYL